MFIQQWMFVEITREKKISTNIHLCINNIFHDIKVLMKVIKI